MRKNYLRTGLLVLLALFVTSCGGGKKSAQSASETTFVEDLEDLTEGEQKVEDFRQDILTSLFASEDDTMEYDKIIPEYNELVHENKRTYPFKLAVGSTDRARAKVIWSKWSQEMSAEPSYFTHCIIDGEVFEVKFLHELEGKRSPDDDAYIEGSIDNEEGYLYEITSGKIVPKPNGADVLMCTEEFASAYTFIPMRSVFDSYGEPLPYTEDQLKDLELIKTAVKERYKQDVVNFKASSVSEDGKIRAYSMMVNMKDPVAIGLTVISEDGNLIFGEEFAVKDDYSTWRVGDGGYYEGHTPIFAFRDSKGTLNVFFASYGAEGANYFTMYQRGDRLIQRAYMAYISVDY